MPDFLHQDSVRDKWLLDRRMCHGTRVIKLDLIISVPLITYWRADLGFESTEVFHKWCLNAGYITFKNSPEKFLLCTWKDQSHLAGQRTFSVQ